MKEGNYSMVSHTKKIWIDLDNSPHVPFFKPIIEELNKRGYAVMLTARDCFQVLELANLFNLHYEQIGRHYGKNMFLKMAGLFIRALQMMPTVLSQKPDLALSHGSRTQVLLANILGIPSVLMSDYEHSNVLPFVYPTWVILPEVIPDNILKFKKSIRRYPGIKEDMYVPIFEPDSCILGELGISDENLVITIRPPATEAHYHNPKSEELFFATVDFIGDTPNTHIVLLPRNKKQETLVWERWAKWCVSGKIIIPKHVVDGLNLIWYSDLVVSGGGTMNREAAALGIPVYSIFCGKIGAVDQYLADSGRLILLTCIEDVHTKIVLVHRHRPPKPKHVNRDALHRVVEEIVAIVDG
jgi:predicted glycosyltransferase